MSRENDNIRIKPTSEEVRETCLVCSGDRKKSKEKCLAINGESGAYICHHCGDHGIIRQMRTYDSKGEIVYEKPVWTNVTGLSDKVVDWFSKRGISQKTLIRNRVTEDTQWMPQVQAERNVIAFNYFRDDEFINVKYRDGEKNFKQFKGAEKIFYGLDDIKDSNFAVVVEGEMDKLAFEEAGVTQCVSVPDGAPNPGTKNFQTKFSYLDNCWEYFTNKERIYLCVDNDTNGKVLLSELSRRLGRERCFIVRLPEDCKDANDALIKHGSLSLSDSLEESEAYPIDGVFTVNSEREYMLDVFDNGKSKGLTTGFKCLDLNYTLRTGELDIWTGIPNHGKTQMAMQVMISASVLYGWKWGVFSPENYPIGDLYDMLAEMYVGNTSDKDVKDRMLKEQYEEAIDFLNEHFFAVYPEDDMSLDNILSTFKQLVMQNGIKGCLIDPWNQLDLHMGTDNETTYIGEALTKIRRFEQVNDLKFIIVAHSRKMMEDERGNVKRPKPYDISGSQNWYNKADNIICIHRPNIKDMADTSVVFDVQKVKFQKLVGVPGEQLLYFDRRSGRYMDESRRNPLDNKVCVTHTVGKQMLNGFK